LHDDGTRQTGPGSRRPRRWARQAAGRLTDILPSAAKSRNRNLEEFSLGSGSLAALCANARRAGNFQLGAMEHEDCLGRVLSMTLCRSLQFFWSDSKTPNLLDFPFDFRVIPALRAPPRSPQRTQRDAEAAVNAAA
jgi:hypothetical protein